MTKTKGFTRAQYMNHECTHREYYAQFSNKRIENIVLARIGKERIKKSKDEHFNDIPMKLWDDMQQSIMYSVNRETWGALSGGSGFSLCETVCIAKTTAHQIKEGE